jgi:hypothetical protein
MSSSTKYILTIEYLINENTNIKKIDDKIDYFMKSNNGSLHKTDIIYNTNKRYMQLSKNVMFNNYILYFVKFSELKKFINNIFKYINNFEKNKVEIKPVNITKYCSNNNNNNNKDITKYENNILITNLTKNNKEKNECIFDIKKYKTKENSNLDNFNNNIIQNLQAKDVIYNNIPQPQQLPCDEIKNIHNNAIQMLQKDIINYYKQNNIIN